MCGEATKKVKCFVSFKAYDIHYDCDNFTGGDDGWPPRGWKDILGEQLCQGVSG